KPWTLRGRLARLVKNTRFQGTGEYLGKFLHQLFGDEIMSALREVRDRLAAIPVDRTRVKPIVKITGEFWAQTTEGDGNFNMFRFLEKEGAQVVVEPIGPWICYLMHQAVQQCRDEKGLKHGATLPPSWRLDKHLKINLAMYHYKDMIFLPIETSGEGDVNAHSRVQMALGEAKAKTKLEFKAALESTGRTLEEIRRYVEEHPELKSPMYKVPHGEGVVGAAANFVRHVAQLMNAEHKPVQRASAAA